MQISYGGLLIPSGPRISPSPGPSHPAHTATSVPIMCPVYRAFFVQMQGSAYLGGISYMNAWKIPACLTAIQWPLFLLQGTGREQGQKSRWPLAAPTPRVISSCQCQDS